MEERMPRKVYEAKPNGKRIRDSPRTTWNEIVMTYGQKRGKSEREMKRLALDRRRRMLFTEATGRKKQTKRPLSAVQFAQMYWYLLTETMADQQTVIYFGDGGYTERIQK